MNLGKLKANINNYAYLHWNISILSGRFSSDKYKSLLMDLKQIKQQAQNSDLQFPITKLYPCYHDKEDNAGDFLLHYFFQDLYVAQRIFKNNPLKHVDIGSRVDGFVAHVATFREIEVLDIRPLKLNIPNIKFKQMDLMDDKNLHAEYTDSISCLHALEHFGLGRYGDPIHFEGFITGFNNITKMLKPNGVFYFSVPMGPQRIEFHAHRVFSLEFLIELVSKSYSINKYSYVDDSNVLHQDVEITDDLINSNCNCYFGCAIFELSKK